MDLTTIGVFGATFALVLGLLLVGFTVVSRWPTSPQHLANAVRDVQAEVERLRGDWAAERESLEAIIETLETRRNRLENVARRAEKKQEQNQEPRELTVAEQMQMLRENGGGGGVLSRARGH